MSYIWNKFNIKTFPAETIVYCDGNYQEQFSTLTEFGALSKKYDLPVHIIYVGKIQRENTLNINLNTDNQPVFLSVNVSNDSPAILNIFIKNAGENSDIRGHIMLKNYSDLVVNIIGEHIVKNSGILLQTKVIGAKNSYSKISAVAIVEKNCENIVSDVRMSGHALDTTAKIRFIPRQCISSVPKSAEHSAYLFHENPAQELYLRGAGLSGAEVKDTMVEAFINDFNLF